MKGKATKTIAELLEHRTKHYDELVELRDLTPLDQWRSVELPALLFKERTSKPYITKKELQRLLDWKLKKGKYRATLPKLIAQNDDKLVVQCSTSAFKEVLSLDETEDQDKYNAGIRSALKTICQLKGVGPATGSLVLSLLSKFTHRAPPFFSDECAVEVLEDLGQYKGKLSYTLPEYMRFLQWFQQKDPEFEYDRTQLEQALWCVHLDRDQ
ncbi:uncharacterized protein CYBJADRAFT_171985 [Cyberlindnera jadinii NRRL Y-1542]|uniref:Uncharacterized protein n=1 Tax=Cyberlindnera jadinii (strain ATCC 18201 / CBS 1600 / BCRC 20928 / JCM 3617 / NBRC 0987 / NRRL Y-1542) TaxID=983966 RepID=A0A1E4S636_CYBJN|nr:hypothetical protein CYBJADRAFT_171985 [Cyberlindnera jadinii NRRL Y-1542]ODV74976.1 hypothetical protein CYBJADRAFT_171985 [Cyberlindnera jadinii NRRL Y-1542]